MKANRKTKEKGLRGKGRINCAKGGRLKRNRRENKVHQRVPRVRLKRGENRLRRVTHCQEGGQGRQEGAKHGHLSIQQQEILTNDAAMLKGKLGVLFDSMYFITYNSCSLPGISSKYFPPCLNS